MTDLHCHILPGIDDGAKDARESAEILDLQKNQGVNAVVLTPHYYSDRISIDDFFARRAEAREKIDGKGVKLLLGAEVAYSQYLKSLSDLEKLCIEGTSCMLLELPFSKRWKPTMFDDVAQIAYDHNISFIIAHVELYPALRKNFRHLEEFKSLGCLFQIDTQSIMSHNFFTHRYLRKLYRSGAFDLVASDCHDPSERPPDLAAAYEKLCGIIGEKATLVLKRNAERVINN